MNMVNQFGIYISFLLLSFLSKTILAKRNNACSTMFSYYFIDISKNCYYNPDVDKNTPDLLNNHFGSHEMHNVTTVDGYIVSIFRVVRKNPKGVVFLGHPLNTDSVVWMTANNNSLAVVLHNAGYEVWMNNNRGTEFSLGHVNKSSDDSSDYWDFSLDEIAIYDYPAVTKYIKEKTGRSDLIFIGHSLGTGAMLGYASLKPEEVASSFKIAILLGPAAFPRKIRSPVFLIAPFTSLLVKIGKFIGHRSIARSNSLTGLILHIARYSTTWKYVLNFIIRLSGGLSGTGFDPNYLNMLYSQLPRGASLQTVDHVGQIILSKKFQMYDYGKKKNLEIYKQELPLDYPVWNISIPIYLGFSDADSLTTAEDSKYLYSRLPEIGRKYGYLHIKNLNHQEFIYGYNLYEELHGKLLNLLNKI